MALIKTFREITKSDTAIAGGKGASLGEMTRAGIPVPPGFVILSDVFEKFLEESDLNVEIDSILHSVDHQEMHTIEGASKKIKALIMLAKMPKDIANEIQNFYPKLNSQFVAVRSSATAEDSSAAAWAGQLESYLNTTESNLLENVKRCWASLFTPRAIFYRFEKELHKQKISVAVVVQKMVESEVSGVAFSVHPVTQDKNQLIIEAGFGLGEAIVSGQITPDSYVVEKQPRRIIDKNVQIQTKGLYRAENGSNEWRDIPKEQGEKQILSDIKILELSKIILRIEKHYGFPCDIEWTYEKGKFYIVQSRPITTLNLERQKEKTKYIKEFARNYSLFQVIIFTEFNKRSAPEFNIQVDNGHPLFIHDGGPLVKIYFPPGEVKKIFRQFGQVASDSNYFNGVLDKFLRVVNEIKPYFEKRKFTKNIEELKYLYELSMDFGYGESMVWVAPLVENLSDETKAKALAVREQTQNLTSLRDELFDYNLGKLFPQLGELTHFILPKSVFKGKGFDELLEEAIEYQKGFVYFDGKIYTRQQDKILKKLNIELENEKPTGNADSISGQSASPGIAKGKVKIVLTNKDIYKVSIGDILVSPMTRPDFVPAMKKAAAFVTDEGGVTCHAAIVAREMKKPCIIGTKIATQILKDGDKVEVDANNGIVKILK
ncbi:hypothetical protein KKH16_01700 [Patescibacteria group bacterium]|nr:hypothetical protein [Patescibacteria group bacterium]MBU1870999.1 hypothetical protein [Patescibacteria group bacterium]